MSEFQRIQFDKDQIRTLAAAHGVDMDNLPDKAEQDKKVLLAGQEAYLNQKRRQYYSMSLWTGNQRLKFTFNDWHVDLQPGDTAKEIGNRAYKLAKKMTIEPTNVFLIGGKGSGKTSIALAMMDMLRETKSVMFVNTAELLRLITGRYDYPDFKKRLIDIERAMNEVDVLVLDDFGTEGGIRSDLSNPKDAFKQVHKDMQEMLYRVLNARFDMNKNKVARSTIVTTNNLQEQLEMMYDTKIISRLITKNKEQRLAFNGMQDVRGVQYEGILGSNRNER